MGASVQPQGSAIDDLLATLTGGPQVTPQGPPQLSGPQAAPMPTLNVHEASASNWF